MFNALNMQSLLGLMVILAACWLASEDRKRFPFRLTVGALIVQKLTASENETA